MIARFEGKFFFLSNFYSSPFTIDGITYPTVEHFFQAQKTTDVWERKLIAEAPTPGRAKSMGRQVSLRDDWEEVKEEVMWTGLKAKFSNPVLAERLNDTGDEILKEGNWWHDNYWGSCGCERCKDEGKNTLGKMLMKLREELRES